MVFVWSNLCDGEPHFTLSQVALNDTVMVFAFAPIVGLLLGLSSIVVPWETLVISVVMFIVIPVIIAQAWRRVLLRRGPASCRRRYTGCSRSRSSPSSPRSCCCSASRASRSWRSR
jgi:ACR3 family arsenite transporter